MLRYASNRGVSLPSLLFTVATVGLVGLGGLVAWSNHGVPWRATSQQDWAYLLGAGTFNVLAFSALVRALRQLSVLFVNAINVLQVMLAALAGLLLFKEPLTVALILGTVLTAVGLFVMKSPASD
jgi:drug/metabolite transporter (DMT)-like permease